MTLAVKDNIDMVAHFEAGSFYSSKYSIKKERYSEETERYIYPNEYIKNTDRPLRK